MQDFDIAKYLRENYEGPFKTFQPLANLPALKEESEKQLATEVPYEGPDPHLDGMGSEYDQVAPVEEEYGPDTEQGQFDRMMGMIDRTLETQLPKIKKAVDKARQMGLKDMSIFKMLQTNSLTGPSVQDLVDDGFDAQEIVDFFATDFSMEEEVTVSSSGVEMEEDTDNVTAADNAAYGADQEIGEPI
jgi:hypothetical protein